MTKLFLITLLFLILGCNTNNSKQTFLPPDKNDINEIIEAVINRDSLLFNKKSVADSTAFPLSVDLRKIRAILIDTTTDVPPPIDDATVSIFDLFNALVENQRFFSRTDSSYFLFQNDTLNNFTIDKLITEKLATTTLSKEKQKEDSNQLVYYYDLTIPILSADNKKAYIELTRNCPGCGGANAFYMEKINSKWRVAGWQSIWMN